jgi:hypothetical protein
MIWLKEIIKTKTLFIYLFWGFIGIKFLSYFSSIIGNESEIISLLLWLIFIIYILPFVLVNIKYKELNWEKQIFCFLLSLIHIFILCFIVKTLIWWGNDFKEIITVGNLNVFEEIFIIFRMVGVLPIGFILLFFPFYFVWKKYKKFTKKRIIFCVVFFLLIGFLFIYFWLWNICSLMGGDALSCFSPLNFNILNFFK